MRLEDNYIQAQIDILEIHLALAGEAPKRTGDFETAYRNQSGKEIKVARSPDGKFASKNGEIHKEAGDSQKTINVLPLPTNEVITNAVKNILMGDTGKNLRNKLIGLDLSKGIQKGIKNTNISSIFASGANNDLDSAQQYIKARLKQAKNELELRGVQDEASREASEFAIGAAALACSVAGFIFGVATYATVSVIKNNPKHLASFMDGLAQGLTASADVHRAVNQLTKESIDERTKPEFTSALNDEISMNIKNTVKILKKKVTAVGRALQE